VLPSNISSSVNNSVLVKRVIDVDMPFQNSPVWMG